MESAFSNFSLQQFLSGSVSEWEEQVESVAEVGFLRETWEIFPRFNPRGISTSLDGWKYTQHTISGFQRPTKLVGKREKDRIEGSKSWSDGFLQSNTCRPDRGRSSIPSNTSSVYLPLSLKFHYTPHYTHAEYSIYRLIYAVWYMFMYSMLYNIRIINV